MRRFGTLLALLILVNVAPGGPVQPRNPSTDRVEPFASRYYTDLYEGGQPAKVIVIGDGRTYLGLYAYDAEGNCVAHDELGGFATRDDRAIAWFVGETSRYTVEVRNLGRSPNQYEMAVK
jgi:hypothetical protein